MLNSIASTTESFSRSNPPRIGERVKTNESSRGYFRVGKVAEIIRNAARIHDEAGGSVTIDLTYLSPAPTMIEIWSEYKSVDVIRALHTAVFEALRSRCVLGTRAEVSRELQLVQTTMSNWLKKGAIPQEHLQRLADALGLREFEVEDELRRNGAVPMKVTPIRPLETATDYIREAEIVSHGKLWDAQAWLATQASFQARSASNTLERFSQSYLLAHRNSCLDTQRNLRFRADDAKTVVFSEIGGA